MENNNQVPQYYQQPEPTWNNDAPNVEGGKGFAITSLVLGILSVICCQMFSIPAIIFYIVARVKGNRSGLGIAGLVCGILGLLIWIASTIYFLTNPDAMEAYMEMLGMN